MIGAKLLAVANDLQPNGWSEQDRGGRGFGELQSVLRASAAARSSASSVQIWNAKSQFGKQSREADIDRDITAIFILAYIGVETTIFIQLIRVDATPKHLRTVEVRSGPPPSRFMKPNPGHQTTFLAFRLSSRSPSLLSPRLRARRVLSRRISRAAGLVVLISISSNRMAPAQRGPCPSGMHAMAGASNCGATRIDRQHRTPQTLQA